MSIETRVEFKDLEVSDHTAALLSALLPDEPITENRGRPRSVGVSEMSPEEFREYKAQKAKERRARIRSSKDDGKLIYDAESAREALADAAIIILAGNFNGADNIRKYLQAVFRSAKGAPLSIEAAAKSGKLKPKHLKLTQPELN